MFFQIWSWLATTSLPSTRNTTFQAMQWKTVGNSIHSCWPMGCTCPTLLNTGLHVLAWVLFILTWNWGRNRQVLQNAHRTSCIPFGIVLHGRVYQETFQLPLETSLSVTTLIGSTPLWTKLLESQPLVMLSCSSVWTCLPTSNNYLRIPFLLK